MFDKVGVSDTVGVTVPVLVDKAILEGEPVTVGDGDGVGVLAKVLVEEQVAVLVILGVPVLVDVSV